MRVFIERNLTDGVLDTRRYKVRCFVENLGAAAVAPGLVVGGALVRGGGWTFFVVYGSLAVILSLAVAATVRTLRGAILGGVSSGLFLLALMLLLHRLVTHPIGPR